MKIFPAILLIASSAFAADEVKHTVSGPPSLEIQGGMREVTTTILVTFELK